MFLSTFVVVVTSYLILYDTLRVYHIVFAETKEKFCASPISKYKALPENCFLNGQSRIDVGDCRETPCPADNANVSECGRGDGNCCTPTEYTTISVNCSSRTVTYDVITACGCEECLPRELFIKGTVVNSADLEEAIINVDVFFRGEEMTTSDNSGEFMFKVPEGLERITMTLTPPRGSQYNGISQTLTVPKGASGEIATTVKLLRKAPAVVINSTEPSSLGFSSLNNGVDLGSINLPANAFYDENGEPVTVRQC